MHSTAKQETSESAGRPREVHKTLLVCGAEHILPDRLLDVQGLDPAAQLLVQHRNRLAAAALLLLLWLRARGWGRPR